MIPSTKDVRFPGGTYPAVRSVDPATLANRLLSELDRISFERTVAALIEIERACRGRGLYSVARRIDSLPVDTSMREIDIRNALSFLV